MFGTDEGYRVDYTTPGFVHPGPSEAEQFFYEHAGWGYHPDRETPEQGRWRGARELARAEREARARGWWVEWMVDDDPIEDDIERDEDYDQYGAILHDSYDNDGEVLGSLWSIDLGPGQVLGYDARPHDFTGTYPEPVRKTYPPYVRVVEAELASEALYEIERDAR